MSDINFPENPIQRANRQNRAACYAYGRFDADPIRHVPSAQFIALVTERGIDTGGFRSLYNELLAAKTATEDQPKPRVWRKGDAEPPADVTLLVENDAAPVYLIRARKFGWFWSSRDNAYEDYGDRWDVAIAATSRPLSEVLADSEEQAS